MTAGQLERIQENLQRLEALLQEASKQEASYADFLDTVLSEEVQAKTARNIIMRTNLARFPFIKSLEAFDFGYQPSVDKKQLQDLATCRFVDNGENLMWRLVYINRALTRVHGLFPYPREAVSSGCVTIIYSFQNTVSGIAWFGALHTRRTMERQS